MKARILSLTLLFLWSCGGNSDEARRRELIEARPYSLNVPESYDGKATPLILTLHGLTSDGEEQATMTGLLEDSDERGFLLAYPDGSFVFPGIRGWNPSCCSDLLEVDDVEYLNAVLDDILENFEVDPNRIYLYGVSNGAFMSIRMVCENAERFAGIFAHAGGFFEGEEEECSPSESVPMLYSHGTLDEVVPFEGGEIDLGLAALNVLGADEVVRFFQGVNSCSSDFSETSFDGDQDVEGTETLGREYQSCESALEFWRMEGSSHIPTITGEFREAALDFLLSQSKS